MLWGADGACVGWSRLLEYGPRDVTYQLVHSVRALGVEVRNHRGLGYSVAPTRDNYNAIRSALPVLPRETAFDWKALRARARGLGIRAVVGPGRA